jgi:hypothetical protein
LNPAKFAPRFTDVAQLATAGAQNSVDFGALFLGLSFFIIFAALMLAWMLFALGVESRGEEIAILAKLGFPRVRIRGLMTAEYAVAVAFGVLVGIPLGIIYCHSVIAALHTLWSGAVGANRLVAAVEPFSVLIGGGAIFAISLFSVFFISNKACARYYDMRLDAERSTATLLFQRGEHWRSRKGIGLAVIVSAIFAIAGIGVSGYAIFAEGGARPVTPFFLSGALILIASWGGVYVALRYFAGGGRIERGRDREAVMGRDGDGEIICNNECSMMNIQGGKGGLKTKKLLLATFKTWRTSLRMWRTPLALRNVARSPGRSLASVVLLSCGMFLVFAVVMNRRGAVANPSDSASGTGGYELFVRLASPVSSDPHTKSGREEMRLDEKLFSGVSFVTMRLREGDEASCLNLNSVANPAVL